MGVDIPECGLRELPPAFGRVNSFAGQLLELVYRHNHRAAVTVGREQITGGISRDVNTVPPIAAAGG